MQDWFKNKGKYEKSRYSWEGRKEPSLSGYVDKLENPARYLGDKYPGTRAANPLEKIGERRQYKANPDFMRKQFEASSVAKNMVSNDDKEAIAQSIENFVQTDSYKAGLEDATRERNRQLIFIYQRSKKDPIYAATFAPWVVECCYREAKIALQAKHKNEAREFLSKNKSLIENSLKNPDTQKAFYAALKADPDCLKAGKFDLTKFKTKYDIKDAAKKIEDIPLEKMYEVYASQLLEPLQKNEMENLKTATDNSRDSYRMRDKDNMEWASICAMQDPEVYAAAKAIQADRCEANLKAYREKVDGDKKEADKKATNEATADFILRAGSQIPEDVRLYNDPDALPTMLDFQKALQKDELKGKKFQFSKNIYMPGSNVKLRERTGGIQVDMDKDGNMSLNFEDIHPKKVERSKKVWDATAKMMDTFWIADSQKGIKEENRKVKLHCTSPEFARVAARAALMRGYDEKNIKITVGEPPKPFIIPEDIKEKAKTLQTYANAQSKNAVTNAITRVWGIGEYVKDATSSSEVKDAMDKYKPYYDESSAILEEIRAAAEAGNMEGLTAEEKTAADERLAAAVHRLNTVAPPPKQSTYDKVFHPKSAYEEIKGKKAYTDEERHEIREAAGKRLGELEGEWSKAETLHENLVAKEAKATEITLR